MLLFGWPQANDVWVLALSWLLGSRYKLEDGVVEFG